MHASRIYDTRSLSALSAGALSGRILLLCACVLVSSSVGGAFVHTKECFAVVVRRGAYIPFSLLSFQLNVSLFTVLART